MKYIGNFDNKREFGVCVKIKHRRLCEWAVSFILKKCFVKKLYPCAKKIKQCLSILTCEKMSFAFMLKNLNTVD